MSDHGWDYFYLELAKVAASKSKDPSTKTGAVIVRPDKSVCSIGFNGFPRGMRDDTELYYDRDEKYSRIIHCEINALLYSREQVKGYTLYTVPFLSCERCFVQIAQAGIIKFIAPVPSQEKLERWGPAFARVKQYAKEMGIEVQEL